MVGKEKMQDKLTDSIISLFTIVIEEASTVTMGGGGDNLDDPWMPKPLTLSD